jgi:hypothetical protein
MKDVLPLPEGPQMQTFSPERIFKEMFLRIVLGEVLFKRKKLE